MEYLLHIEFYEHSVLSTFLLKNSETNDKNTYLGSQEEHLIHCQWLSHKLKICLREF